MAVVFEKKAFAQESETGSEMLEMVRDVYSVEDE